MPKLALNSSTWTGCESNPTPAECVVTMTAAKTVEAEFKARTQLPLAVKKTGTGKGTVTSAPSGINCGPACHEETHQFYENETVTLTEKAEKLLPIRQVDGLRKQSNTRRMRGHDDRGEDGGSRIQA